MSNNAQIISIEDKNIQVVPILTNTCISCTNTGCTKRGTPFFVQNPSNLNVKIGDIVEISASKKRQVTQAFISIIIPIGSSILFYYLSFLFAKIVNIETSEELQVIFVLLGLSLSAALVLFLNGKNKKISKSEITTIIN